MKQCSLKSTVLIPIISLYVLLAEIIKYEILLSQVSVFTRCYNLFYTYDSYRS